MCAFITFELFMNIKYVLFILDFMFCIVEMGEVSPKMKEQKNFLFIIFGSTCPWICTVLSNHSFIVQL
jgi:hypothetical protein